MTFNYKRFQVDGWTQDLYAQLVEELLLSGEEKYRQFSEKLLPDTEGIIGIRLPELRKLAAYISRGNYKEYLALKKGHYFEEIMVEGFVIGNVKTEFEYIKSCILNYVPKINNWSVCDSFCSSLKIAKTKKANMLQLIETFLKSENEYELRFAIVMLLNYYIEEDTVEQVLTVCDGIRSSYYYVNMAIAWNISICYVRFEEITLEYLNDCNLDAFTYAKALQKICESHQVSKSGKRTIQRMREKLCKSKDRSKVAV